MTRLLISLLLFLFTAVLADNPGTPQQEHRGYQVGEKIYMECKNAAGEWGRGPICQETGEEMHFQYGVDSLQYCGWHIDSVNAYNFLKALIKREVWGIVEADHIHVDNHLNFIFHADAGLILGVAAYPVRDQFQVGKDGTVLSMHGFVKWFRKHSFNSFSTTSRIGLLEAGEGATTATFSLIAMWSFISFLFALAAAGIVYRFCLRPRLVRKFLKRE